MPARGKPLPGGLHPDELGPALRQVGEGGEEADGVGTAPHRGDEGVGQAAEKLQALPLHLLPDDALEVPDHHGVGVGAHHGAQDVEGGAHVRDPVADGLVGGVLEGAAPRGHGPDLGPEELHAEDV